MKKKEKVKKMNVYDIDKIVNKYKTIIDINIKDVGRYEPSQFIDTKIDEYPKQVHGSMDLDFNLGDIFVIYSFDETIDEEDKAFSFYQDHKPNSIICWDIGEIDKYKIFYKKVVELGTNGSLYLYAIVKKELNNESN